MAIWAFVNGGNHPCFHWPIALSQHRITPEPILFPLKNLNRKWKTRSIDHHPSHYRIRTFPLLWRPGMFFPTLKGSCQFSSSFSHAFLFWVGFALFCFLHFSQFESFSLSQTACCNTLRIIFWSLVWYPTWRKLMSFPPHLVRSVVSVCTRPYSISYGDRNLLLLFQHASSYLECLRQDFSFFLSKPGQTEIKQHDTVPSAKGVSILRLFIFYFSLTDFVNLAGAAVVFQAHEVHSYVTIRLSCLYFCCMDLRFVFSITELVLDWKYSIISFYESAVFLCPISHALMLVFLLWLCLRLYTNHFENALVQFFVLLSVDKKRNANLFNFLTLSVV
jgi:hypothetical protein